MLINVEDLSLTPGEVVEVVRNLAEDCARSGTRYYDVRHEADYARGQFLRLASHLGIRQAHPSDGQNAWMQSVVDEAIRLLPPGVTLPTAVAEVANGGGK